MNQAGIVVSNKNIGGCNYLLRLKVRKGFKCFPGQFINLEVSRDIVPLLRRPFSVFDFRRGRLDIVYKKIGVGTSKLSERKPGEELSFIGPLGNSYLGLFRKDLSGRIRKMCGNIVLIGGGTGAASVHFLASELKKMKVDFTAIQGAASGKDIVASAAFKKIGTKFTTVDGSFGTKGLVTDILMEMLKDNTVIFACGPKGMLKAVYEKSRKRKNVHVYGSFEEYMGCGIGACVSCVIEVKSGKGTEYKRVCKDGTVFDLKDIVWEES